MHRFDSDFFGGLLALLFRLTSSFELSTGTVPVGAKSTSGGTVPVG
jgi:hypothetical protein